MNYTIHLSEKSDYQLQQMCASAHAQDGAISREDFLSALIEQQLGELFEARPQQHDKKPTRKDKKVHSAVTVAKQRARAWREAAAATQLALESVRKLVSQAP
jgi:hypothetical protein